MKSRTALFLVAAVLAAPALAQTLSREGEMPDYGTSTPSAAAGRPLGAMTGAAVGSAQAQTHPAAASATAASGRLPAGALPGAGDASAYPQPSALAAARQPMRSFAPRHDVGRMSPN